MFIVRILSFISCQLDNILLLAQKCFGYFFNSDNFIVYVGWLGSKLRLTELKAIISNVNSLYHLYGNATPWLEQYGFLPTQKTLGSGPQSAQFNQTIPLYNKMITMFPMARSRPCPSAISTNSRQFERANEDFNYGIEEPKQTSDDAAAKSAKVLGW
jgi:hypothetical protein